MTDTSNGLPTPEQAEELLREAAARNSGPWEAHSRNAALAAQFIAQRAGMDADAAHTMALLHDICLGYGVTGMRHALDGYNYLTQLGFERAARICLTHTFEGKDVAYAPGPWDCTAEEYAFLHGYIHDISYDEYDRLVQLCDTLADARGFCLMERRYVDVSIRRGVQPQTPLNWRAALENRAYFDGLVGGSVYRLLPGIVENTFGLRAESAQTTKQYGGPVMSEHTNDLPTPAQAEELLREAAARNPGLWEAHSRNAALAARLIAQRAGMDADAAYTMGLLHDIGRRFGVTGGRHILDGYNYLTELGFDRAARICLTHSFSIPDMDVIFGKWDCTPEEYAFVEKYIHSVQYDDYDLLIQICDALGAAEGFWLMEKRIVNVALRYGVMDKAPLKWKAALDARAYFEQKMGCSVYSILPGVVECTFGF